MTYSRRDQNGLMETSFMSGLQENVYEFEDNTSEDVKKGRGCDACMSRMPYATLIATIMCLLGVGVFCGTMHRGATLAVLMFDQVFHLRLVWIEAIQMVFVVIGASMAALGFMILFVGCLATGATRRTVYKAWRSRVGGRISCAVAVQNYMLNDKTKQNKGLRSPADNCQNVQEKYKKRSNSQSGVLISFMAITYTLQLAWISMFCFLVIVTFVFTIFWNMCARQQLEQTCIDFQQFDFMFPNNTRVDDMKVCGDENKLFCKDYVEKAEWMFILATFSCLLIILSLVHYLMCLAANYAHIRGHTKFQELYDLHYLNDPDMASSKDRF